MSKFSSLPDIDDAPDVYESEAIPTILDAAVGEAEEPESADIAHPRVSVPESRKKFGKAIVDARDADFGGVRGYRVAEREVYDDEGETETPAEMLARLTREVGQLKQKMGAGGANAIQEGAEARKKALTDQVGALESDLAALETVRGGMVGIAATDKSAQQALLKQLAAFKDVKAIGTTDPAGGAGKTAQGESGTAGDKLTYELYLDASVPSSARAATLADLDGRLASLEKALGPLATSDPDSMILPSGGIQAPQPLLAAVEKMEQQLNLLSQPRALDILAMKIRRLAGDLDRIAEARTRLAAPTGMGASASAASSRSTSPARGSGAVTTTNVEAGGEGESSSPQIPTASIRQLFSTLTSLQPVIPQLPALLLRLKALQQLHTEAATILDSVSAVSEGQDKAEAELRELRSLCAKLEKSMAENATLMQGNIESLTARMDKLKESIGAK